MRFHEHLYFCHLRWLREQSGTASLGTRLKLTSHPGKSGRDMGKTGVEGAGESQEEGATCAKAPWHTVSLTPTDSHTKGLRPFFHI